MVNQVGGQLAPLALQNEGHQNIPNANPRMVPVHREQDDQLPARDGHPPNVPLTSYLQHGIKRPRKSFSGPSRQMP